MWSKFRHKVVYFLLKPFLRIYLRVKFGYRAVKSKFGKGPAVILFNHPTNVDPIMVALSFEDPIYFMATDDLFSIKYISPILKYLVAPIPKRKSYKDIQAVKDCIRVCREGAKVSLSPEGNRTYSGRLNYINPVIVKLVRILKVPLILYTISGGFGVEPRFGKKVRRGKCFGEVKKILFVEDIAKLTDEELYKEIVDTLSVDDLDLNLTFKSPYQAEYLESLFYVCPVCGGLETLASKGKHFKCSKCDLDVIYNERLRFETTNEKFNLENVYDWYKYQEDYILNVNIENNKLMFKDQNVTLIHIIRFKKIELLTGLFYADFEKFSIEDGKNKYEFKFEDISSVTVLGHNKLRFYVNDEVYQIKSDIRFNAIKYMHLYYHVSNTKKGVTNESIHKNLGI